MVRERDDAGHLRQGRYRVRFGRGEAGLRAIAPDSAAVVIVDVLSFSTAVDVALGRGATIVPYRWAAGDAVAYARAIGAEIAVERNNVSAARPYSLSPATLAALPVGTQLVLPSPNGAMLVMSAIELGARNVVVGSLRNASAVGAFVRARAAGGAIAVVAAGERWHDGSLRPALEDDLGAGTILARVATNGEDSELSPECSGAVHLFAGSRADIDSIIRTCVSGRELTRAGFAADVGYASALDVSDVVPIADGSVLRPALPLQGA